ncbi:hypothetical protein [Pelagicoccus mobilis]|uniref:Uncharacterized protein n=1 Tax=Pelagicoccus mobilis TaxID=415221 RepID=A0A934VTQ6_9BACT|nr:hypothetical protein [Pelagicoccus mobilis]MBK1879968.1 hypothetical protein [Pelagicoccus mobilis]
MDSERLRELKKQKALILEHLEWINVEIDRETIESTPSTSPHANRLSEAIAEDKPVSTSLDLEASSQEQVASDVYDQLGPDTRNAAADAKKGCMLIGAAAFAALAGIVIYVSFYY